VEDERLRQELMSDAKERSENIMALDVMRHDLSRIARPGSVRVEALCAVRSYPRVHQLVSTVSARRAERFTAFDVARIAFPMASMTGAPKARAMELIQEAERGGRGLFSGSLGYFAPNGEADLNVVIRAVLFNMANGHASLRTGSALTARCVPALEWEECEVKARSVIEALEHA
jgi:para-aminobenzoate synthetase component 1